MYRSRLKEVAWDYQIVGTSSTGEFEVLLVAIKSDVVEALFQDIEKFGLVPQIVDVSTAALSNSFRFNYPDMMVAQCCWTLEQRRAI
jgi:type IV pilus assembly protein PilM